MILVGSQRFRPASKHGLPFVAWTRSESFAMTAFKNLPPWSDFLKGRESDMLRMRKSFTKYLVGLHEQTLAKHSEMKNPKAEDEAYDQWADAQRNKAKRKKAEPRKTCPACETWISH